MINILIADDEPLALIELRTIIPWEDYGFQIFSEVRTGGSALKKLREHPEIDLAILDINMPAMTGLEVMEQWKKEEGKTEFLIISAYSDYPLVRKAFKTGISDYILKEELEPENLIPILEKIKGKIHKKQILNSSLPVPTPEQTARRNHLTKLLTDQFNESEPLDLFSGNKELRLLKLEILFCRKDHKAIQSTSLLYLSEQLIGNYFPESQVVSIDNNYFLIILLNNNNASGRNATIKKMKKDLKNTIKKYFNLAVSISGGNEDLSINSMHSQYLELKDLHSMRSRGIVQSMDYIRINYGNCELNFENLCSETGISRSHLSTLFKQETGLSYKEFLNEVRISHAINLLETTEMKVQEVSDSVGFSNVEHFSRTFKDRTGISPSTFTKVPGKMINHDKKS